jgi:threonine dehydrogenase-like Zn-dependent dehydrogenase
MLAVHIENGAVTTRDIPIPHRAEGFALLRLLVAGICNTDLELQRGYYGFSGTPGHEFVAEVAAADTPTLVGKRVVGEINLACTECGWCRKGLGRHCPSRRVLGIVNQPGAFEEFFVLPELAGRQGFEPRYAAPEAAVLPLDDVPRTSYFIKSECRLGESGTARVVHWESLKKQ